MPQQPTSCCVAAKRRDVPQGDIARISAPTRQTICLSVLCDRQNDGDDHPTVFVPVNDALLALSGLHRDGTDWAGLRRYKRFGLLLHTTYDRAKRSTQK